MNIIKGNEHPEEFRQPTFPQLLQTLAHLQRDCPACGGDGLKNDLSDATIWKCSKCGGSGKVFVLHGMVRERCGRCKGNGKWRAWDDSKQESYEIACPACGGLGTIASQDMGDWVKAAHSLGYTVVFQEGECCLFISGDGINLNSLVASGADFQPFEALARAIQKAVGNG